MSLEKVSSSRSFGGEQIRYKHESAVLSCTMHFSVYMPPGATQDSPVLYWLSGLTCSDENFVHKAGAQRIAAELGLVIVTPDTSPRGEGVPDAPDAAYDLGLGAGFYLNATQEPWRKHYQMYDYIVHELPALLESNLSLNHSKRAISGHSMGGHGALVVALRNPGLCTNRGTIAVSVGAESVYSLLGGGQRDLGAIRCCPAHNGLADDYADAG